MFQANGWTQKQLGTNWHHLASSQRLTRYEPRQILKLYSCKSGDSVFFSQPTKLDYL